jgi:propionyl-CoA carboxylase alpha chain
VRAGFRAAGSEARSSFGDDRVFIERFIEQPRHIEIQILGDGHGNIIHLGERECSIQRRHQKIIEEAPSPFLDDKTRLAMGRQAVALADAVGYQSAGTVEFIVDAKKHFYFLEMNTRLQVEHPVTEAVIGLDLVEQMIRIAAGEKLAVRQRDVKHAGWAIEARVYAEDPERGFLPSTGRLVRYREPTAGGPVRIDSGVHEGAEIGMFYDPMIAKVIGTGADRREAIAALSEALDAFYIRGVSHNIRFLSAVLRHPRFTAGRLTTGFIAEAFPEGFDRAGADPHDVGLLTAVAAVVHHRHREREAAIGGRLRAVEPSSGGEWVVMRPDASRQVTVAATAEGFAVIDGESSYELVSAWRVGEPLYQGTINGRSVTVQVESRGVGYRLAHGSAQIDFLVVSPRAAELAALMPVKRPPDLSKFLLSPMPGLLVSLAVQAGQEVKVGQEICVVEAMKMENLLRAERDGRVSVLHAKSGDSLAVDQPIVEFE